MTNQELRDPGSIVSDRRYGADVKGRLWTSKDVTILCRAALANALETKPGVLASMHPALKHFELTTVLTGGECSVTVRRGRKILIYELKLSCKWQGKLCAADSSPLSDSASGELRFPDISAESIDDLEVEFDSDARGSPPSEAMRKDGIPIVKRAIQQCMSVLQSHVSTTHTPKSEADGGGHPLIKPDCEHVDQAITLASPPPTRAAAADGASSPSAASMPMVEVPLVMRLMLAKVRHFADVPAALARARVMHVLRASTSRAFTPRARLPHGPRVLARVLRDCAGQKECQGPRSSHQLGGLRAAGCAHDAVVRRAALVDRRARGGARAGAAACARACMAARPSRRWSRSLARRWTCPSMS